MGRLKLLEMVWTKGIVRTGAGAALLLVSLATLATVGTTLSVPPVASRPHQVLKIGAGCCSSPSSALVRLRGGSSDAGAEVPWEKALEEGGVLAEAGDLASAIASYTRGLKYDSTPPNVAVPLYYSRGLALLRQKSFIESGEDARSALAFFSGGELLNPEGEGLEIKRRLIVIAIEADLLQAAKQHIAGDWAGSIASYTRALACESAPPENVATVVSNRAAAFLQLGSFVEAIEYARAGLAFYSGGESLDTPVETVLSVTQQLNSIVRDAALGVAVEQAAANTSQVSMAAQTTIEAGSLLWTALRDLHTTKYMAESSCQVLPTSLRFLATVCLYDCITVFASSPGHVSLGAHINTRMLLKSLDDIEVRGRGGLPILAKNLALVFGDVDASKVNISLVGGHKNKDFLQELKATYYPGPQPSAIHPKS